jgi:outer membrane protein assembly factor BamD
MEQHSRGFVRTARRGLLPALLLTASLLAGCSTFDGMFSSFRFGEEEEPKSLPPETHIVQGMDAYETGDYRAAIKSFNSILDEHPFSAQAMLAELKVADAYYYNKQYAEAKTQYKAFEERHPTNEAMPYVLFQIGMCDFMRSDRIDRDSSGVQDAIKAFNRLMQAYPESPYSKEARLRIVEAKEFLANHEYYVADFYVRTERYAEAAHRLKFILAMHPDSSIAPQAKALLDKLEAGDAPVTGMRKWLPEFMTTAPAEREAKQQSMGDKAPPPAAQGEDPGKE